MLAAELHQLGAVLRTSGDEINEASREVAHAPNARIGPAVVDAAKVEPGPSDEGAVPVDELMRAPLGLGVVTQAGCSCRPRPRARECPGLPTGVAVPVRNAVNEVVAALSVIVPNDGRGQAHVPVLVAAARGISRALSGTGRTSAALGAP